MDAIIKKVKTMKKCKLCGTILTRKSLDIDKILLKEEAERLYVIRKEKEICSECSITMLMIELL